ncbi:MAG: hypothetical protein J5821_04270 [Alphaproteobacteria bacterium]|nr:hypothetical protein [Alphaproteobacteria bacterium]
MKIKLRRLGAVCVVAFGSGNCFAMNLDTSMMRPTKPPLSYELWNRINEQNIEISNRDRIIEKQKRQSKEKDLEIEEKDRKIADLEAEIQKLRKEREAKQSAPGLPHADSCYGNANDSNLTLNCEAENSANSDSEFSDGSIPPIDKDPELSMMLSPCPIKDSRTDMLLPPPSVQVNSRENNACLMHFSPYEKTKIPPAPPLPAQPSPNEIIKRNDVFFPNKVAKSKIPPAPPLPAHHSSNRTANLNIPPALSSSSNGNIVPHPPRNPLQNSAKNKNTEDSQDFIESMWADPRKNLNERLKTEQTAAKIVNIYLKKNPAKAIFLILSYEEKVKDLAEGLRDYEVQCKQASNSDKSRGDSAISNKSKEVFKISELLKIVSEISDLLENFRKAVNEKRLKTASDKFRNSANKLGSDNINIKKFDAKFSDISQRMNRLAIEYFNEINKEYSSADLKGAGDFIIEGVKIADSLSDLENLWKKSENPPKFPGSANTSRELDKTVKFALDILHLEQKIASEIDLGSASTLGGESKPKNPPEVNSLSSLNSMERRCLELSLEYIRSTRRGHNQLSKLLKMRDHINNGLSQIKIPDNREHPLSMISKLPKDMDQLIDKIADLFSQAFHDETESSYSLFGTSSAKIAEEVVQGYSQIRNSANIGDSQGNFFRNFFKDKSLNGKFGNGIIKLITVDRNLCPHFEILLRDLKSKLKISPRKKISSQNSKEISADFKNSKFLCLLKSSDGDILPLSRNASTQLARLKDRASEVVEQVTAVSDYLMSIPSYLSDDYKIFGQKSRTLSDCVSTVLGKNPALSKLIEGNSGFSIENKHIVVETDEGKRDENFSLTNNDMSRIIFAIILNRDLVAESKSKLFLSNENISENEIKKMAGNLAHAVGKIKESLEFVMSKDAFESEELRSVFKVDNAASTFNIIKQLDGLIEKIGAEQNGIASGIENTVI